MNTNPRVVSYFCSGRVLPLLSAGTACSFSGRTSTDHSVCSPSPLCARSDLRPVDTQLQAAAGEAGMLKPSVPIEHKLCSPGLSNGCSALAVYGCLVVMMLYGTVLLPCAVRVVLLQNTCHPHLPCCILAPILCSSSSSLNRFSILHPQVPLVTLQDHGFDLSSDASLDVKLDDVQVGQNTR